ncbi:MAG: hypothetical protein JWM10_88, partial [Myxococcaceae bacterium]|nr:hypothetical protein [Myxococcaceae bacterium]
MRAGPLLSILVALAAGCAGAAAPRPAAPMPAAGRDP